MRLCPTRPADNRHQLWWAILRTRSAVSWTLSAVQGCQRPYIFVSAALPRSQQTTPTPGMPTRGSQSITYCMGHLVPVGQDVLDTWKNKFQLDGWSHGMFRCRFPVFSIRHISALPVSHGNFRGDWKRVWEK